MRAILFFLGVIWTATAVAQTPFSYTGSLQTYTVPAGITSVRIEAAGAQGGSVTTSCTASGGLGARMQGDVAVTPGEVLTILVGQQGLSNGSDGGGGGGSFVVRTGNVPLVVAGGGGGATNNITNCGASLNGANATTTTSGTASGNGLVAGGASGNGGGASGGSGGGGGGLLANGTAGSNDANSNGKSFLNGGAGGSGNNNDSGGYGGGGAGWFTGGNGGGGGGYSGGGTSSGQPFTGGGGGGSFNSGTNQVNVAGSQSGNGSVTITNLCSTVVTNGSDSGTGSLRQIVADTCPGATITFDGAVSTVTLTSAEISINKNLTIDGGASLVTVTRSTAGGTPNFRIFNVQSGNTVSMNALTVSNGNHLIQAGGIQNSGSLTLTHMHITGNRSPQSGGLQNDSVLNLSNTSVTNNVASSFGGGLGVAAGAGTTTLANCTFTGNQGGSDTGAIGAGGASLTITNCTIAGNTLVNGGGLGAGITTNGVSTTLRNSIVIGNTEGGGSQRNIDGNLQTASAFNVLGTGPAGGLTNGTNSNQVGLATALLGSLANYGGLTPTLPLLPGSVAINAGSSTSAPTNDQRGIARVGNVDVGAFESRGFSITLTSGNAQTAPISTAFAAPLVATVASANSEPVQGGVVSFAAPGSGASAVLGSATATIAANGQASTTATANATTGSYTVSANTTGNSGSALSYSLDNRALSADLSITKTDGVTTAIPGGSTTYTITASNAGPDAVTGATVADTFPASLNCTWTCSGAGGGTCPASGSGNINSSVNLPVSGSVTFTASCTISPSATGSLSNTATVSSSITDPTPGNNSATDTDTLTRQADVSITNTDGQTTVAAGGHTTYTITASNAGPSNAPGTTVADTFPAACVGAVTWTCSGAGGGSCAASGSGNMSEIVNLPSGGSVVFSAICAISTTATGTLSNTATVAVAGGITDPTPGNNSATDTNTITTVPGAPTIGTATAGNAQATVAFTAPGSAGGSAIIDYTATCGAQTATAAASPITVTGLTNGVTYSCTVVATNSAGAGNASAPVQVIPTFRSYTAPSPTGTGSITASFTGGGATCNYSRAQYIPLTGHSASPPAGTAPTGISFPHGLFDFITTGCTPGSAITVTVTYPQPLSPDLTKYWKYGPTPSNPTPNWYVLPATISGATASFTITDGQLGDDDLQANGSIVDQGGPGVSPAAPVPLSPWLLLMLALSMLATAARRAKR